MKKVKSIKKGKATRNFDKIKSKRTHNSINSVTLIKDRKTQNNIPDEISRMPSIGQAGSQTPRAMSNESYTSISEEDLHNASTYSKGNFDKLMEYRNNHKPTLVKRKTSIMSNFAQFKSFQNNEFWLQSASTNNEKFPVPVTVEIDRFMLNYLEQPGIISKSTASLQDEKHDSQNSSNLNNDDSNSFTTSSDAISHDLDIEDLNRRASGNNTPISARNDEKMLRSSSLSQKEEQKTEGGSYKSGRITPIQQERTSQMEIDEPEKEISSDFESKLKDKLLEVVRVDLETIEERHEEDNEMLTRVDLDNVDKLKIKSLQLENVSSIQEKMNNAEANHIKENHLKTPNQLTTIVLTSEASPKMKPMDTQQTETEANEIFNQMKPEDENNEGVVRIDIERIGE